MSHIKKAYLKKYAMSHKSHQNQLLCSQVMCCIFCYNKILPAINSTINQY